jgi:hypothetical protein
LVRITALQISFLKDTANPLSSSWLPFIARVQQGLPDMWGLWGVETMGETAAPMDEQTQHSRARLATLYTRPDWVGVAADELATAMTHCGDVEIGFTEPGGG